MLTKLPESLNSDGKGSDAPPRVVPSRMLALLMAILLSALCAPRGVKRAVFRMGIIDSPFPFVTTLSVVVLVFFVAQIIVTYSIIRAPLDMKSKVVLIFFISLLSFIVSVN